VVLRYNPRDITSILIYREDGGKDIFLSRAHATGLETEMVSYAEAQAMRRRVREAGKAVSNQSMLNEVRSRDREIEEQQRRGRRGSAQSATRKETSKVIEPAALESASTAEVESEVEAPVAIAVPDVRVYDYEALREEFELW